MMGNNQEINYIQSNLELARRVLGGIEPGWHNWYQNDLAILANSVVRASESLDIMYDAIKEAEQAINNWRVLAHFIPRHLADGDGIGDMIANCINSGETALSKIREIDAKYGK